VSNIQKAEGILRNDLDEGWVLDGEGSRAGVRICDLFPGLEGKRAMVSVQVLSDVKEKLTETQSKIPNSYKVSHYREDETTGGCITQIVRVEAWTAADAIAQMELTARRLFLKDRYFSLISVEPWKDGI